MTAFALRPYQAEAIQKLRAEFKAGRTRLMLQLSTGGGKTLVAATMIKRCHSQGKRAVFICDREELIDQTSRRFDGEGIPHGVIQAQHERCRPWELVQIASIQTLQKRKQIPEVDLVIIDEGHTLFEWHKTIMAKLDNVPVIALSATPWSKGLGKHFQSLVVVATPQELIDDGFLVGPVVYAPSAPELDGVKTARGDYENKGLAEASNLPKLVGDIVAHWLKLARGRRTLCFAVDVAHSKAIVAQFQSAGVVAEHLDGYQDKDDRREIIARFRRGEIEVLSSCEVLTKGFDAPEASCAILARPTKSLMVYVQQVGRVLRIAEGKTDCLILDHAGNTERLGFATDDLTRPLDMGKKPTSSSDQREKEEPLPKKCPACHFMKPPKVHACPQCGFAPERQSTVETEAGTLVKLTKSGKSKASQQDKQATYSQLLAMRQERGYSPGWVANQYRAIYGVWPRGLAEVASEPTDAVRAFVRSQMIRFAKGKEAGNERRV